MEAGTYAGYAYAYPHKTSYRPLDPPVTFRTAWETENRDSLFLYVHIPFCEMRCGFCNLFTSIGPEQDFIDATMAAIERQSNQVADLVEPDQVTLAAFGGGTPSFLRTPELVKMFDQLASTWSVDWADTPTSFEISPGTVDREKLAALKQVGISRISMGVQSFVKHDLKAMARPQKATEVEQACGWINELGFDTFNLDLIYGTANQTAGNWLHSLEQAVEHGPNELYLYPLYVRALTGLGRTGRQAGDHRRELYRLARDYLTSVGFVQQSMRLFRRASTTQPSSMDSVDYSCQEDAMVGLGPGARSYTSALHYSSEYAVKRSGVDSIIDRFNRQQDFSTIDYGIRLDIEEQHRRYVIKSLLRSPGLDEAAFHRAFDLDPIEALPQLVELEQLGLAEHSQPNQLVLTPLGMEYSDTIGPWLYSAAVNAQMDTFELV